VIRDIYAAKGFTGQLLDDVVETITANRDTWLTTMIDEELHLQPVESRDTLRTAAVIGIATDELTLGATMVPSIHELDEFRRQSSGSQSRSSGRDGVRSGRNRCIGRMRTCCCD
jgi:hypothetical protein